MASETTDSSLTPAQVRGAIRRQVPPRKRRMNATVFDLALGRIKPTARGDSMYAAARMVMVDGCRVVDVTRRTKISRQSIYEAMDKIENEYKMIGVCPTCGRRMDAA